MTEKNGLTIGFLTKGKIDVQWATRLYCEIPRGIPSGTFWNIMFEKGEGYREKGGFAKARINLVNKAKESNVKWLFMIDDDVFIPPDAITKLLSTNKKVVTGIYYSKSLPPQPILYKSLGNGPYWNFPVDELFKVEAAGAGCLLIDMDVFDKFDEAGIPYFKENWEYKRSNGTTIKVNIGEDYWFFYNCNKLGIETYADSSVLCDHVDYDTWKVYPGEEEVKRIQSKAMPNSNHSKTIVFYNDIPIEFDGNEINKRPVGGAETCIINIANKLSKDYNVYVVNSCINPGNFKGVNYVNINNCDNLLKELDIDYFVTLRVPPNEDYKEKYDAKNVLLWAHDLAECPVWDSLPNSIDNLDYIITVSDWHKSNVMSRFPWLEQEKFKVLPNGFDENLFYSDKRAKGKKRLIYSSTPFRGLKELLDIFPDIKKEVPEAELHICSSMEVYLSSDKPYEELYSKAKEMEGVVYHGSLKQEDLAEVMRDSYIYTYPSTYSETYCISTSEANACGLPIVTTSRGALPETIIKGNAILVSQSNEDWLNTFKKELINLLKDEEKYNKLKENIKFSYKDIDMKSWTSRAKQWSSMLNELEENKKWN